jgi:hypothetical protein
MSSLKKIGGSTAKKAYSDPEVKVTRFDNEVYCYNNVVNSQHSEEYTDNPGEPA